MLATLLFSLSSFRRHITQKVGQWTWRCHGVGALESCLVAIGDLIDLRKR